MSSKKHSKELRRREKMADKLRKKKVLEKKHEFPQFVFEPNDAPAEFVEAVKLATNAIDFRDESQFRPFEKNYYKIVKDEGSMAAYGALKEAIKLHSDGFPWDTHVAINLGHQVLSRIPSETLLRYIPFSDVLFGPAHHSIRVIFRTLRRASGMGGTTYFSHHEPTVEVGGQRLVIAFSRHAIERFGPRVSYSWPSYAALGDVFSYLAECLDYEVVQLYGGQIAFCVWNNASDGTLVQRFAKELMSTAFREDGQYRIRVGYCPAVIEGRFLKAKTLLFPGFTTTPEYSAMVRERMPFDQRRAMRERAGNMSFKEVVDSGIDMLKWFHDHGVEQVRLGRVQYADSLNYQPIQMLRDT